MKKQKDDLVKQADALAADNKASIQELKERVKLLDATKYQTTEQLEQAIASYLNAGYNLTNTFNSVLIFFKQ